MADFPTAIPDIPVASPSETLFTMHAGLTHVSATNRILTNLVALATKLGTGAGGPGATAGVLRRTASGVSAWGQVAGGDLVAGTVKPGATVVVAASNASAAIRAVADVVCSGTGDQNAINTALTAMGPGRLQLSEGTFNLTAGISLGSNQTLAGMGDSTVLRATNGAGNYNMVTVASGGIAEHFLVDGNKQNNTAASQVGCYAPNINSTVRRVTVINPAAYGIFTESSSQNTRIIDCYVNGANTSGYTCRSAVGAVTLFDGCVAVACQAGFSNDSGTVLITNCIALDAITNGIVAGGPGSVVHNCVVKRSGNHGISNSGADARITHNTVTESSQTTPTSFVNIVSSGSNAFIAGNLVRRGALTNKPSYGIWISGGSNAFLGQNDTYDGGSTAEILDSGTNTRRAVKLQYSSAIATDIVNGVAVTAGVPLTIFTTPTFRVDNPTSIVEITVRGSLYYTTGSTLEGGSYLQVDGAGGARLGGTGQANTNPSVLPLNGTYKVTGLTVGTHTVTISAILSAAATAYLRASASLGTYEHLAIHVTEYLP